MSSWREAVWRGSGACAERSAEARRLRLRARRRTEERSIIRDLNGRAGLFGGIVKGCLIKNTRKASSD